jgi:aryl-alcohol dehydrogenase-like predicted oxidoreductase
MTPGTEFEAADHRGALRRGTPIVDRAETFSGVPYEVGLEAVEELRHLVPEGASMVQFAIKWILMHDAVASVIPGIKSPAQAQENAGGADLDPLPDATMRRVAEIYGLLIAEHVHLRY